jgi:predicted enzyme involved in methoxymalonyl-ACP biosynthesis
MQQECVASFAAGTRFFVFDVEDRFTSYGIVGVVICQGARIRQFVMSCRVVGMDVEVAAIAELLPLLHQRTGASPIAADLSQTELNHLARDLWERCGFQFDGAHWIHAVRPELACPPHVTISIDLESAVPASLQVGNPARTGASLPAFGAVVASGDPQR